MSVFYGPPEGPEYEAWKRARAEAFEQSRLGTVLKVEEQQRRRSDIQYGLTVLVIALTAGFAFGMALLP